MREVMMAWVGRNDLNAPELGDETHLGPIANALQARVFDEVYLLADYPEKEVKAYLRWLKPRTDARIEVLRQKLTGPTEFGEIWEAAIGAVETVLAKGGKKSEADGERPKLTFHLSPGTPAMAAVWIMLGKTRFPATLIESSREQGVRDASVPFDLAVDFLPELLREQDQRLREGSAGKAPEDASFQDILHRSKVMKRAVERARRVAMHDVPVLIEGESGTGKEMFARAMHRASPRKKQAFVPVNCGAIPAELVESQLFGHEKGAFTGADKAKQGFFEAADGGTLFLDEVGELPLPVQVKLLRVLQEGEVTPVGGTMPRLVNVRILAATNRVLTNEIAAGRFREDLFYRLAVGVLTLPPLRDRQGDLSILIDHLLADVNREQSSVEGHGDKRLSAGAKNVLLGHAWPGNVRELRNTLLRTLIWSTGKTVSAEDCREALFATARTGGDDILGQPLSSGFNLQDTMATVARHYLERGMQEAGNNKTKAAELLGLSSYQTLTNWLEKYEVQP